MAMTTEKKIMHSDPLSGSGPKALSAYDIRLSAHWDGNDLWFRGRLVASLVPDGSYAGMWHVVTPNGAVSGMANWTRARDAAMYRAAQSIYTPWLM